MHAYSPTFYCAAPQLPELTPDRELLSRSAADDADAFNAFFARHRDGLQGFLYRRLRSHEDAEDGLALTFCNAWRARSTFRGNTSGKAWLYQIATRVSLDMLRRRRRRSVEQDWDTSGVEFSAAVQEEAVDPAAVVVGTDWTLKTQIAVREAMQRLPEDERKMVSLFYFDGRNYDEISSLLGVSRSQVRGRLHRIRGRIRRDLVDRQRWTPAGCD